MRRAFTIWVQNFFAVGDPEWAWRRRAALGALTLAFFMMLYATVEEKDFQRFSKLLDTGWLMVSSVMTIYVGGAVVDTINKRNSGVAAQVAAATTPPGTVVNATVAPTGGPTTVLQAPTPPSGGLAGPQAIPPGPPRGSTPTGVSA